MKQIRELEIKFPRNLDEALRLLDQKPGRWTVFAGGTDLMVLLDSGQLPPGDYLNITNLAELKKIGETGPVVFIGALATHWQLRESDILNKYFPLITQAASVVGSIQVQNRGTIGGNMMNASPAADATLPFLVYDAQVELQSLQGARLVPYRDFHISYKGTARKSHEILTRLAVSQKQKFNRCYFRKVGARAALTVAKVSLAAAAQVSRGKIMDIRLAMGSVAPIPLRCLRTEAVLRGQMINADKLREAQRTLAEEINPLDDIRSTRAYRLKVSQNLFQEFWDSL